MAEPFPWPLEYRFSVRRKTLVIEVREARVLVRAPAGYPQALLEQAVRARAEWIAARVAEQRQRMATRPRYRYTSGESLPYLGQALTLEVGCGPKQGVYRKGGSLIITTSRRSVKAESEQVYGQLLSWYRRQAQSVLTDKTQTFSRALGQVCRSVRIRATRSKWGHCTRAGDIQYNWQILLAPEPVVDYLVAHEVSHLRHHHHGAAFWQQVAELYPGYKPHRQWLRAYGHTLFLPQPE